MPNRRLDYLTGFVDKLSGGKELDHMVPEILEDLCSTFDFGCGFVYEKDHVGVFHLRNSFTTYAGSLLAQCIHLTEKPDQEKMERLAKMKAVYFRDDIPPNTEVELYFSRLFSAKSMVLVPVVGQDEKLMAIVGLVDRRGKGRHVQEDMVFCRSVISALANYIKMHIYRQQAENAQRGLEGTLDNMGIDVYVNDFDTHEILYLNSSMAKPYGGVDAMMGKVCWQALYDDKTCECEFCPRKQLLDEEGKPTKVYSWDYQRPFDGAWFRVFSAAFRWVDGRLAHIISSVDISENKRNEEIIRQMAEFDYLTGLPNRYKLTEYIDEWLLKANDEDWEGYLLFFDLDRFKLVNDTKGHQAGDELLKQIGQALQNSNVTKGITYRFGGDEFVVFWDETAPVGLDETIVSLQQLFTRDWELADGTMQVGASIGISHFPSDDVNAGDLIRKADQAMYASKNLGRGQVCFYNQGNILEMSEYYSQKKEMEKK